MNVVKRKLKRSSKVARIVYFLLSILYLVCFIFFLKNVLFLTGIETALRVIVVIFFGLYFFLYVIINFLNLLRRKYKVLVITSVLASLFIGVFLVGNHYIDFLNSGLDNMKESEKVEYASLLITLKDKELTSDSIIGRISNKDDLEGFILAEKLYEKEKLTNTIKDYDNYILMLSELVKGEIDGAFVTSNYASLYSSEEGLESIETDTRVLYKYTETMQNQDIVEVSDKDFSEPLTFLIMGVDSEKDGLNANAGFNGDTLMLVAFNPDTLETTMVSIPRDTYVPIACNHNKYAKINSAAGYSTKCVIDTVGNFLDVKIDYYIKINFKGVVDLVDAVGGVEVDVEAPTYKHHNALKLDCNGRFCEQNSNREIGSQDIIYLDPGVQTINGEEALAYARCRYLYAEGDMARIRHQQQVVEALTGKIMNFSGISDFQKILNAISKNMVTNMDRDKILSGYTVIKKMLNNSLDGKEGLTINKAKLETYSLGVYLPYAYMYTSAQGYYADSLEDIQNALKTTLGLKEQTVVKTFSFSVNETYEVYKPGAKKMSKRSSEILPNFVGKTVTEAENFGSKNNINIKVEYVNPGDDNYESGVNVGLICKQSEHEGVLLSTVSNLTVYVANSNAPVSTKTDTTTKNDEEKASNTDDTKKDEEIVKDLIGDNSDKDEDKE